MAIVSLGEGGIGGASESQSKHKEPKAATVGCKYLHVPSGGRLSVCTASLFVQK